MAMKKLTKVDIERPKVPANGTLVTWDTSSGLGGFGVRVAATGRVSFIVRYWNGTRERWKTLGAHPRLTLTEARKRAREILRAAADGVDPLEVELEAKAEQRAAEAQTIETLAAEWLEVLPNRMTRRGRISPRTVQQYEGCMRLYILPAIGKRPVLEVTKADVRALHTKASKSGDYQANRVIAVLSVFYSWLAECEAVPEEFNPARKAPHNLEKRRGEYASVRLSYDQEARLSRAIYQLIDSDPVGGVAILTLLDTGRRLQEILGLEWRRLNLENGTADLGKTKGRSAGLDVCHLTPRVVEAIRKLPRVLGNIFVFVGNGKGGRRTKLQYAWETVKTSAGLLEISPDLVGFHVHDLRHHRISEWLAAGIAPQIIARQVGHTSLDQLRVYSHLEVADVKAALSRLEPVGPAPDAEVVEIGGRE